MIESLGKKGSELGVLVCMNDSVHAARYCTKRDSQLMGAFESHPGPIAQLRGGRVIMYYDSLPPIQVTPSALEISHFFSEISVHQIN